MRINSTIRWWRFLGSASAADGGKEGDFDDAGLCFAFESFKSVDGTSQWFAASVVIVKNGVN